MLKLASFGLLGFLLVLMLPANVDEQTPGFLYGAATIVAHDAYGNEIFSQTIHNQLFDQGEQFIINQAFTDIGVDVSDIFQIGAICLSAETPPVSTDETDTKDTFNTNNGRTGTLARNCVTDPSVTNATQIVTLGPLTFTAGADATSVQWVGGDTVTNIGVCDADGADANVRDCTTTLFAVVDTSDVTLANTETVDVTYTFDISSDGT